MSYFDRYINQCPAFGWQGGPEFSTRIVDMANGRERRNATWSTPRHKYSIPFRNIKQPAYMGIKQMHLDCRGKLHAFKFFDALDNTASGSVFGTGDGTTKIFQLGKVSVIDGISYARPVYVIQPGATFKSAGATVTPTVDLARGLVTFGSAPAAAASLTWTGGFAMWVRFDQDDLPFSLDSKNKTDLFINGSVSLIEVPPPPLP